MSKLSIYLSGPIFNCEDADCVDWRKNIENSWSFCKIINPMRRDYRHQLNNASESLIKTIVELDKEDIVDCQCLLVNYTRPSVGTSMEILYAFERKKLVVVVTAEKEISPWLKYHSDYIVFDFNEAEKIIKTYYANLL